MKYSRLFVVREVVERQGCSWWKIYACLLMGLLAAGCAATIASYKIDNTEKASQMGFSAAIQTFQSFNKEADTLYGLATGQIHGYGIVVTGNIHYPHSGIVQGSLTYPFGQVKNFSVRQVSGCTYVSYNENSSVGVCLDTPDDARRFVETFIALKYYFSRRFLADDTVAFADFQEKAGAWRALPVKPALPDDLQRFRVAAEEAFKNKNFYEAACYYEHGLAVEPLWPQGQYNAALLEGGLQWYGMAAFHMKRYLELNPDAEQAKADREKMYLWEEKATETPSLPDSMQETFGAQSYYIW